MWGWTIIKKTPKSQNKQQQTVEIRILPNYLDYISAQYTHLSVWNISCWYTKIITHKTRIPQWWFKVMLQESRVGIDLKVIWTAMKRWSFIMSFMTLASQITRTYNRLYLKTSCWYSSTVTFEIGAKLLNLLSLLQIIWFLISSIYLKPMERLLGISVRRHWLYSSALKKCNA